MSVPGVATMLADELGHDANFASREEEARWLPLLKKRVGLAQGAWRRARGEARAKAKLAKDVPLP
jgi:hypothetical protein